MSSKSPQTPKAGGQWRFSRHWGWKLVLVLALLYAFRFYQQHGLIGGQARALPGETLNGAKASLEGFRGRPGLIHFWASWCEVCQAMSGNIEAVSREKPVVTVVSLSGNTEQVAAYLRSHGLTFPVVVDPQGRLAKSYGVTSFPTTVVISKRGKILYTEVGYTTELGLRIRLWLAEKYKW
jgi:thiol-disulfide isomerase/thioredoxin